MWLACLPTTPHDPGSKLRGGDCCFLFLSIESDSKSHRDYNFLLRIIQFYNIMVPIIQTQISIGGKTLTCT